MTVRVYWATHNLAGYNQGAVVLLDDTVPEEYGLTQTGYFEQLVTPEDPDAAEGPDRA